MSIKKKQSPIKTKRRPKVVGKIDKQINNERLALSDFVGRGLLVNGARDDQIILFLLDRLEEVFCEGVFPVGPKGEGWIDDETLMSSWKVISDMLVATGRYVRHSRKNWIRRVEPRRFDQERYINDLQRTHTIERK